MSTITTDTAQQSSLIKSFREKSKSPKPRTKKEVVEEELDETIKALEKQVSLNLTKQQQQHPSVTTTAGLGNLVEILMMTNASLLLPSVTRAAVSVRDAAGAVREVAENILKSLTPERQTQSVFNQQEEKEGEESGEEEEEEEEMSGYDDDFSVGIDLPLAVDSTSGNVTPTPTTGELEELRLVPLQSLLVTNFSLLTFSSVDTLEVEVEKQAVTEEVSVRPLDSRSTPLKSLLKKPSFEMAEPSSSSDSESEEGKVSPGPKKVHFSEIDQVSSFSFVNKKG